MLAHARASVCVSMRRCALAHTVAHAASHAHAYVCVGVCVCFRRACACARGVRRCAAFRCGDELRGSRLHALCAGAFDLRRGPCICGCECARACLRVRPRTGASNIDIGMGMGMNDDADEHADDNAVN